MSESNYSFPTCSNIRGNIQDTASLFTTSCYFTPMSHSIFTPDQARDILMERIDDIEERVDRIDKRNIIAMFLLAFLLLTFSIIGIINAVKTVHSYSEPEREIIYMTEPDDAESSP